MNSTSAVTRIYRFFRSVRLAVILILVIVALSMVATFIPQGEPLGFYEQRYSPAAAGMITALHMDRLFSSALFLLPVGLFLVNLTVCTLDRMLRRARAGASRRHGPDLIHIGLLILTVGGLLTATLRREKLFFLSEGDQVEITGGYRLTLERFLFLTYPDGRPRDWISTIRIEPPGGGPARTVGVEVNKPLHLAGIKIYQSSYDKQITAHIRDDEGRIHVISRGEGFSVGEKTVVFADVRTAEGEPPGAIFQRWKGKESLPPVMIHKGERMGDYTLAAVSARLSTGLTAVRDPGFIPVFVGLIVSGAGLTLTFLQKRKEQGGNP